MNATPDMNTLSLEDALSALGESNGEFEAEVDRHAPVCRFREHDHDLFVSDLERDYRDRNGESAVAAGDLRPGENRTGQSATGMSHERRGRTLFGRVYQCDPAFESVMPDMTRAAISRINRITGQVVMTWVDRPAHGHLISTESVWRISSTARFTGESAALATGDASSHRDLAQTGEP